MGSRGCHDVNEVTNDNLKSVASLKKQKKTKKTLDSGFEKNVHNWL